MTNFWDKNLLTQMHIELTNGCNAACPMCVRFLNNSPHIRPDLEVGQITLDKFKQYFPPHIIKKTSLVLFCGVHGDPCTARDTFEICQYIHDCSESTAVRINTNGGMRRPDWWTEMGKLFHKHFLHFPKKPHWEIVFSIDGLEDTNHLYRRNVDWHILIDNVRAFITAGGYAVWDYLIFKHNEHQLDQARDFSKQLGFRDFVPKKALGVDDGQYLTPMSVLNKDGKLDYWIEAPDNPINRNLENPLGKKQGMAYEFDVEWYRSLKSNKDSGKNYQDMVESVYTERIYKEDLTKYDNCEISCKSYVWHNKGREIFVDNFGRVMPCCYIGTHLNGKHTDTQSLQLHKVMNDYGWDNFSLEKHTLDEILDAGHLDRVFADTWSISTVREGKLAYCSEICGKNSRIDKIFTHETNDKMKMRSKFVEEAKS